MGPSAGLYGCGKSRPPPGFNSRIVQPVASRYTGWNRPTYQLILNSRYNDHDGGDRAGICIIRFKLGVCCG